TTSACKRVQPSAGDSPGRSGRPWRPRDVAMKGPRALACLVGFPLVLAVALYAPRLGGPGGARGPGAAPPEGAEDEREREGVRRVAAGVTAARGRAEARRAVVAELSEGGLSLREAAARFHEINGRPAHYRAETVGDYHRGESDSECLCRQVIDWTQAEL